MERDLGSGQPGPSGFRNLEPRSREERLNEKSKDLLEKSRIQARSQGPRKPNVVPVGASPVVPVKNSPMYCDEYDRFNRDVAGELHRQKVENLQKKEEVYSVKRAEKYYKDKERWDKDAASSQREEQRLQAAREAGTGARRNKSSESYNILTLNYSPSPDGAALQVKDETTRYKAQLRAQNLYSKNHSVTHNIITGQPLSMPQAAPPAAAAAGPRPVAPWEK